jgi:hypothetical protein
LVKSQTEKLLYKHTSGGGNELRRLNTGDLGQNILKAEISNINTLHYCVGLAVRPTWALFNPTLQQQEETVGWVSSPGNASTISRQDRTDA